MDEAREWSDDDDDTYEFQDDMDSDDLSYDDTDDKVDDTGVDIPHNGPSITETDHGDAPSIQPPTSEDHDNHDDKMIWCRPRLGSRSYIFVWEKYRSFTYYLLTYTE